MADVFAGCSECVEFIFILYCVALTVRKAIIQSASPVVAEGTYRPSNS